MANVPTQPLSSHDFDDISSLGKYKIQRKVGSGGMGAVYLAVDQQLKRTVALKVLPKDKASNQVLVRRFKAEGQAGAQMEHPNIVSVYESGEIDGYLYLAMEFVEGIDAFDLLRKRGVLPAKRSLDIIKQVTLALQHAYEKQIVHRDIKPSNLMIRERDGMVKLADLGLARIIEDDGESAITKAGTTVGTVDYMSPEQGRDSKFADIRSDIYSLGCTWYHLLAGKAPYPDGDLLNKLRSHALQPIPDPRNWNENVPSGVVAVMQRMMAKKPEDRYQTPAQLMVDLNSPTLLRGDFSADQLQLLRESDSGNAPSEAASEVDDSESPKGPRRRPVAPKPGRTGNSPSARAERADAEEKDEDDTPSVPQKSKSKNRQPAGRESLPARTPVLDPASAESDGGKRPKTERTLPGRIDKPLLSEPPSTRLDPNTLKLWLLGLVIASAVGGMVFVMQRFGDSLGSAPSVTNPYATGESGDVPPTASPSAPNPSEQLTPPEKLPVQIVATTPTLEDGKSPPVKPFEPDPTNPESSPADLDQTPFGGEIALSPNGSGALPKWVWQSRFKTDSKPTFTIRRRHPAEGEFRDFATALATVQGDAVIEFGDVGPHEFPVFEMKHSGHWTIRAADRVSPVLIVRTVNSPISVTRGTLTLDGVHVVLMPEQTGPGFRVSGATLVLRRSSVTHLGPSANELLVAEAHGRILLENTLIRAMGNCHPVILKGMQSSLVAGQSLLIAGNASAIQLESIDTVGDTLGDSRVVTLVRAACLSGQSGLTCLHSGKQPPTYEIQLLQSVLAYLPGHTADAIGVQFTGWPKTPESLDRPRVPFVNWVAENSAFVGWPHWAQLGFADGTAPVDVRDEEAWRAFWRLPTTTGVLIPEGADLQAVTDSGALASSEQVQIGLAGIRTPLAEAGPKWSELPEPPRTVLSNVLAFRQSSRLPASLETPDPGSTFRFDLKKPTLGRFINSNECPDGSTVIAFGSGLRTIDPFVVRQKRVQILFEQSDGTPLIIQPGYKTEASAARAAGWFSVEDGQLTLTNGSFRLMSSTTRTYPERFLQMTGGLVALRKCRIEGVDSAWPIIDIIPAEGHAPPQLLIDQSLITGMKSLVRVGAAESVIEVRGSVLHSSTGVAVTLDTGTAGSQCSFNNSTLSAAKSVYQVLSVGPEAAIHLFARESVFQGGGVMSLETDASSIHWWGIENAYASGMKSFLLTRGKTGPQDFNQDWVQGWGAGHELLPVFGTHTTLLPTPSATLADVDPESFQLHADCDAAQAGPQGAGLGATLSQVGPVRKPPAKGTTPSKTPPKNPPSGPQKNNPGF